MAIAVSHAVFGFKKGRVVFKVLGHLVQGVGQVVGVNAIGPEATIHFTVNRQPQHGTGSRIQLIGLGIVKALRPHAQFGADDGQLKLLAGVAQAVFGVFALGDVAPHAQHTGHLAVGVTHGGFDDLKRAGIRTLRIDKVFFKR